MGMSTFYKCDGCGRIEPAVDIGEKIAINSIPHGWFQRKDEDGVQDACSRECIKQIAANTGKTDVVLPW